MSLCSKLQVKLPEKGIIIKKDGKYPYVYHVDSYFRNEKGVPTHKKRSIGKLDSVTGMLIPNETYYKIYGEQNEAIIVKQAEMSYGEVKEIGVVAIVSAIFEILGIAKMLIDILGEARFNMIKTVVSYMLSEGNAMHYIDDFCDNSLFCGGITDKKVSSLFASLSFSERMSFFKEWVKMHIQNEYIAYDVTSYSTYSKNIDEAEFGHNRDKESLPQINMAMYMGQTSLLPMFYVIYNGSIVDKSHFPYMMTYNAELGIENVSFVMDRGFATTDNAEFMRAENYPFILGAEIRLKTISQSFDENKQSVCSPENYILSEKVYGLSVKGRFYGITATLHIFYDPAAIAQQTADFFRKIAVLEDELNQINKFEKLQVKRYTKYFTIKRNDDGFEFVRNNKKIDAIHNRIGYFFILTNQDLNSEEVISIYRKRDVIEKGFDEIKNGLDMSRLRTHTSETTEGKLFCAFLALICRLNMQNKLREIMDKNNISNERIIRELSKIRAIEVNGIKRLLNPLTKIQKEILCSLGLKLEVISDFIADLNL